MVDDLRHAYRSLRRSPRTTIVAIVLFAATLGVTTAIYAVVDAVLLRPSAMRTPGRTVVVWQRDEVRGTPVVEISYDDAARWRENAPSLDTLGVFSSVTWSLSLIEGEARSRVSFVAVSPSFFDVAGIPPARGRILTVRDEAASEPRVALLSDGLWRQRFAADPRVIGRLIRVRAGFESPEQTLEIIGVMPPAFDFPRGTQLWLPAAPSIRAVARQAGRDGDAYLAGLRVFYGLGRLRDGVSAKQLAQEIGPILQRQNLVDAAGAVTGVVVTPIDAYLQGPARPVLWIMLGGALLMALLACSSVAGLQVFRAALAERALAVHLALGAARRSLVTRAIAEGLLLALGGVVGALGVAAFAVSWFVSTTPLDIPRLGNARLASAPVLAFMALLAATAGVLTSVWPALFAGRIGARTLTSGARAVMHPRERRAQRLVVGWQVAVAVVLLAGAALFVRSVRTLDRTDVGFRADGLVSLEVQSSFREPERADVFYETLLARTREWPGVAAAGAVFLRPLNGPIGTDTVPVLSGQEGLSENAPWRRNPRANLESIAPGSFRALGVPLLSGRDFTSADVAGARDVVIVSASAAARYWPGRDPIGQRLVVAGQRRPPPRPDQLRWQTVVGVVGDIRYRGVLDPRLDIYVPAAQSSMRVKDVLVRVDGDPESVIARVRAAARELDPGASVGEVVLMSDALARESAPWRFAMRILMFFGGLATVLATVGLVGVVWLVVAMRRRELGVRATLGATPAQLRRHVLTDAVWTDAAATAIGVVAALFLGQSVAGFVLGTTPHDPLSLTAAALVTFGTGVVGAVLAADGAARISPIDALRD